MMRPYPTNSPEALARLVALAILADGRLHNQEVTWIREHDTASLIGVEQDTLVQVLLDCCRDLLSEGGRGRVDLLSEARLAPLAEEIADPALRKVAISAVLVVAKSDGRLSSEEQTLLRFLLSRWDIELQELV
ncbi:MAG TPA: TerB family tellurite resistance protein [Zoogloea sp.]|uniref:TerB family tellurite resistance protein n=1 Tax=Zoogloea sp. TaxID=49181 RepID=UPI002C1BA61D|nr:TerB family tellurite resistance protein [Zoogloea sp.]HMY50166.1 TerB family tellurite resistance protein [Rhodocyclaceae bacterium]HMZ74720.1 TerB family tellurite resistance protein [Rhodocyclaceae bacterium]HNC78983.1 TerB family tellurite resistance protein [Rhodocyclaceae bacterium]HND23308.1 TerB family tellurite resistance protein [Rhodocyclaceae bacterium]HNE16259.1 TerB family tellurite resistance protein [Rhodocyclaceae bacterium]